MKQSKFKDVPGMESINTPMQLDTFESSAFRAMKDRFIFDFSQPLGLNNNTTYTSNYYEDDDTDPASAFRKNYFLYSNNTVYDQSFEQTLGIPGNMEVIFRGYSGINDDPDYLSDFYAGLVGPPIEYEDGIPYWNKNAIMYMGTKTLGAYGQGAGTDLIKSYRSGYIEFTIKTDNQNCIISYGSAENSSAGILGVLGSAQMSSDLNLLNSGQPTIINSDIAVTNDFYVNLNKFFVSIKNGKLSVSYSDNFGEKQESFEVISNKTIADNQWHHVVINIGKPGTLLKNGKKSNKRFIELWVDGKSDKIDNECINNKQVFFPLTEWLFGDPNLTFKPGNEAWETYDDILGTTNYVGYTELQLVTRSVFNPIGDSVMFTGQLNHYVVGLNTALSPEEIGIRYNLYKFGKFDPVPALTATATLVAPTVSGNKKRALRLFWNNEPMVNGIQLDDTYSVDTVSVTHKTINSPSEVFNIDVANEKSLVFLPDARIALTDHVNIFGPGKMWLGSLAQRNLPSFTGLDAQTNLGTYDQFDALSFPDYNPADGYKNTQSYDNKFSDAALIDLPFSNISLNVGDKILLTNQIRSRENGIYVFNGYNQPLVRDELLSSPKQINNGVVHVTDGIYENTSWMLESNISSITDPQKWVMLESHPNSQTVGALPIFSSRYLNETGEARLIDFDQDVNLSSYDMIVFLNYPETVDDVYNYFIDDTNMSAQQKYRAFINQIKVVTSNGANLYVSSPRLAEDLGIVKKFTQVSQLLGATDGRSAAASPFEVSEPANRYFDTHRNNYYHLATQISGLTDKETWLQTDFVNFLPKNAYDYEQWHSKYSYRQFGIQEGNEFLIPGLSLRQISDNESLPGFRQNTRGTKDIYAVDPSDILAGTVVTKFSNNYYNTDTAVSNPYDDYATTIVVHNGQQLGGTPINGKIFVNCTEDGYTFSRRDYNKAVIQVIPNDDPYETITTRNWQYSTTRLNRNPKRFSVNALTEYGQTVPTNGGGGALVQAGTNSSNGIIRSVTDLNNKDYESDLYPDVSEEIYEIQEIPTLSMTWLGLSWLAN